MMSLFLYFENFIDHQDEAGTAWEQLSSYYTLYSTPLPTN